MAKLAIPTIPEVTDMTGIPPSASVRLQNRVRPPPPGPGAARDTTGQGASIGGGDEKVRGPRRDVQILPRIHKLAAGGQAKQDGNGRIDLRRFYRSLN